MPSQPLLMACSRIDGDESLGPSDRLSESNMSRPTSSPISSMSSSGPIGMPHALMAESIGKIAPLSVKSVIASRRYGKSTRLTRNPGASFTTIGVFPAQIATATPVASTLPSVRGVRTTSTSGIFDTGLKKCRPITLSGCLVALAMAATLSELVLLARTASG